MGLKVFRLQWHKPLMNVQLRVRVRVRQVVPLCWGLLMVVCAGTLECGWIEHGLRMACGVKTNGHCTLPVRRTYVRHMEA